MSLSAFVCLAIFAVCRLTTAAQISLSGEGFFSYDLSSDSPPLNPRQSLVQLRFRTIHPTGLLMYSEGERGDFLRLENLKGTLHYTSYLGGSHNRGISSIKYLGKDLNDGEWHNVTLTRDGRKSLLQVDSLSASHIVQENYQDLNLDGYLYIGGMKPANYRSYRITGTRNFRGCLEDVKFNGKNLAQGAVEGLNGFKVYGPVSFKCGEKINRVISFSDPDSGVKITVGKLPRENYFFSTSFQFRTHIKDGLLISQSAVSLKLHLVLSGGVLVYDIREKNCSKTALKLGENLNDGEWHEVSAAVTDNELSLTLDGQLQSKNLNYSLMLLQFVNKHRLKFLVGRGGREELKYPGFVGCILNLKIGNHEVTTKDLRKLAKNVQGAAQDSCHLQNFCEPNPCKNEGKCFQDWQQFYCDCDRTQFEGKRCEIPIYKPTCEYYKSMGLQADAFCLLDSRGMGVPYTALCNVTSSPHTYTVITHNKMTKTRVGDARLVGSFYKHDISYTGSAEIAQIAALIQKSEHCRQSISFHCFKSKLLNSPRGPSHAFWLSRDGSREEYWGGADPGSKKCACGMSEPSSCEGKAKYCNCDIKDEVWRVDEGYLTDKRTLPVTGLLFYKKSEKSDFVLGPLECWGTADEQSVTNTNEKLKDSVIDNRLTKACPVMTRTGNPLPATTSTRATKTVSRLPENGTISQERNNGFLLAENATIIPDTGHAVQSVQNKSNTEEKGKKGIEDEYRETGLSVAAIVATSVALIIIILLFITFDRMNRRYKSPFPCKFVGAPGNNDPQLLQE